VFGGVVLGGLFGVVFSLHMMAVGQMTVMAGLLVLARFVVLRSGQMVFGSMLVVLGCFAMLFGALSRHGNPLSGSFGSDCDPVFEHTRA
jgi:hypothetical protein